MKHLIVSLAAASLLFASGCNSDIKTTPGQAYFKSFTYSGNDAVFDPGRLNEGEIFNPVLQGAYSDASICCKGGDYYMALANYTFYPGIPILHSKDLVNWEQISYALSTEQQLLNTSLRADQGIYPSTIRYDAKTDRFYITGTLVGGGGHFIVWANDPKGPWSNPEWLYGMGGVHSALFFDDNGKCYITNQGNPDYDPPYTDHKVIWLQEIDINTFKLKGERKIILAGGDQIEKKPTWLESPHIFKRGNYYILLASEGGGLGNGYSTCVYRSENVWGPYEHYSQNPILTQRRLSPGREDAVTNTGRVDMVQNAQGDWWAVFQGVRPYSPTNDYFVGRETYMLPVKWDGDWPYIIRNGDGIMPKLKAPYGTKYETDSVVYAKYIPHGNFTYVENFESDTLPMQWAYLRTPVGVPFVPNGEHGLVLPLEINNIRSQRHAGFLGLRVMHNNFAVETELHFLPQSQSEFSGIALYLNDKCNYELGVSATDDNSFVVRAQKTEKVEDNLSRTDIRVKRLDDSFLGKIYLRIERCDDGFAFQYKLQESDKYTDLERKVPVDYFSLNRQGGFMGLVVGPYASQEEDD